MHRASGQGDLSEAFLPAGLGRNARLERIAQAFDWSALERQLAPIYAALTFPVMASSAVETSRPGS